VLSLGELQGRSSEVPWNGTAVPPPTGDAEGTLLPSQENTSPSSPGVGFRQYERHGVCVIAVHGACDMDSVRPLADALRSAAAQHPKVILDASGITFADSSFLNLLILTHGEVALRVAAPSRRVERLFEISGVDHFLEIRATVDEAAAS
jgi:anti-anti-sigma factor